MYAGAFISFFDPTSIVESEGGIGTNMIKPIRNGMSMTVLLFAILFVLRIHLDKKGHS
jgi:hypothetical protein